MPSSEPEGGNMLAPSAPLGPMWDLLPGSREIQWERTSIGVIEKTPPLLRAFVGFATSLPHPAAVFWDDSFILLFNGAWRSMHGDTMQQGQSQASRLDSKASDSLRLCMDKQVAVNVDANSLLLDHAPAGSRLLISPIVDFEQMRSYGVLAQLLPFLADDKPTNSKSSTPEATRSDSPVKDEPISANIFRCSKLNFHNLPEQNAEGDGAVADLPLDEHPFFRRIAAMLPTGIAILNHKAEAVYVNQQFYELTTHYDTDKSFRSWPNTIHPEHYGRVMKAYQEAFDTRRPLRTEFRAQGKGDPWRLLLLSPIEEGNLSHASVKEQGGFICAVVDITTNKQAELSQRKAAKEAQGRKEQQERFIDMISHEIRNPLSAVLHCAEDILDVVQTETKIPNEPRNRITEAADTITLCVAHQKNIVDDILSFSKLDASMMSLSPRSVQPKRQLADSLKMFQPEFRKLSINFEYKVDWSYDDFKVDWVKADLVRISQVLVNLITNSIKFTAKKRGPKEITVAMGASMERPTSYPPNVVFFDTEDLGYRMDGTNTAEWGNGETLYLMVAVIDNGIGISDESQKKLFQRFRQATPRTQEIYGGSGLGLNISRKICHLHGGEIGVSSKEGVGSKFGFFFKVRRAEVPPGETPPAGDRLEDNELSQYVQEFEASPSGPVNENEIPNSLRSPKYQHVQEASADAANDHKWSHTAEIASHVKEKSPDRYGQKGRPTISRTASAEIGPKPSRDTEVTQGRSMESSQLPKLLLVEDNLINQRILRRKLETKGFFVLTANNGREAVQAVKASVDAASSTDEPHVGFSIILMDMEMPIMDGNAASKEIRQWERSTQHGHVPILGVSANVREEQKTSMLEAGMDDVIGKPYKIEEMVDKIRALIRENWRRASEVEPPN